MQYPNKLILVPLKSSEYAVEIVNAVANITLTQLYVNPTDSFLEVGYSFPISPEPRRASTASPLSSGRRGWREW